MKPGRSSHTQHDRLDIEAGHDVEQLAPATRGLLGRVHAALTRQQKTTKVSTCRRDDGSGNQENAEQHRVSPLRFVTERPHHSRRSNDECVVVCVIGISCHRAVRRRSPDRIRRTVAGDS
jgi:hypothetical protein